MKKSRFDEEDRDRVAAIIELTSAMHPEWSAHQVQESVFMEDIYPSYTTVEKYMASDPGKRSRSPTTRLTEHDVDMLKLVGDLFPHRSTSELQGTLLNLFGVSVSHVQVLRHARKQCNDHCVPCDIRGVIQQVATEHPSWKAPTVQRYLKNVLLIDVCLNTVYRYIQRNVTS